MEEYGLTKEEQEVLKPYFLKSHGVPPSQEQMMMMLMDPKICNFSLADANGARKIVGKKVMSKIPALREQVLDQASSPCMGHYVWKHGIGPQMGYSFSIIHALAYSFIGFQTAYAATRWNPIYWNTANLIVNSASLESDEELDDEAKEGQTDYAKLAKALGDIISAGINVSLVDINKSQFSFKPDVENNQILFGMKALSGINSETIEQIIANRPYANTADFMARCPLNKTQMISLIKAGAFDKLEADWGKEVGVHPRIVTMAYYLSKASEPKSKLNLQNFSTLLARGLVPESLDFERKVFEFNKYLKANTKVGQYFVFNDICSSFYEKHFNMEHLEVINGLTCIKQKTWDKIYQKEMDGAREWLKEHQDEVLNELNAQLFLDAWEKYAKGNLSSWEMESLCFYYHDHELANVDTVKYGISNFFSLPDEPEVEYYFTRNGKQVPIWKTHKIIGTVIAKNDNKATISLLTPTGVVNVKFTKEYYANYKKQLSEKQEDGTKKVTEKGWFKRGTMLMLTGFRRGDQFVTKTYKHTPTHQLYKIELENNGRDMILTHERKDAEE
jgi:DNA polymerase-3 subunit alpha